MGRSQRGYTRGALEGMPPHHGETWGSRSAGATARVAAARCILSCTQRASARSRHGRSGIACGANASGPLEAAYRGSKGYSPFYYRYCVIISIVIIVIIMSSTSTPAAAAAAAAGV